MLLLDPENRVSAAEGLTMPYFKDYRDPEGEKEAEPYDHSVDNSDLTLSQWKRKDGGGRDQWKDGGRRGEEEDDLSSFIDHCPAVLFFFFLGHTFTEILTFKPVVIDPKETSL